MDGCFCDSNTRSGRVSCGFLWSTGNNAPHGCVALGAGARHEVYRPALGLFGNFLRIFDVSFFFALDTVTYHSVK